MEFMDSFFWGNDCVGVQVAHNAQFDVKVLCNTLYCNQLQLPNQITMCSDTLKMAQKVFDRNTTESVAPTSNKLGVIYKHLIVGQHRWWIRLYGVGLDEAAQNSMILLNLSMGARGLHDK